MSTNSVVVIPACQCMSVLSGVLGAKGTIIPVTIAPMIMQAITKRSDMTLLAISRFMVKEPPLFEPNEGSFGTCHYNTPKSKSQGVLAGKEAEKKLKKGGIFALNKGLDPAPFWHEAF